VIPGMPSGAVASRGPRGEASRGRAPGPVLRLLACLGTVLGTILEGLEGSERERHCRVRCRPDAAQLGAETLVPSGKRHCTAAMRIGAYAKFAAVDGAKPGSWCAPSREITTEGRPCWTPRARMPARTTTQCTPRAAPSHAPSSAPRGTPRLTPRTPEKWTIWAARLPSSSACPSPASLLLLLLRRTPRTAQLRAKAQGTRSPSR